LLQDRDDLLFAVSRALHCGSPPPVWENSHFTWSSFWGLGQNQQRKRKPMVDFLSTSPDDPANNVHKTSSYTSHTLGACHEDDSRLQVWSHRVDGVFCHWNSVFEKLPYLNFNKTEPRPLTAAAQIVAAQIVAAQIVAAAARRAGL